MPPSRHSRKHRRGSSVNIPDLVPRLPAAPQLSCPLFNVIPAEIRNRIYALSLESEDIALDNSPRSLYQRNAFYYRPGYKQPKRIESGLLQTCQQIYAEASLLPPGINEHTFWFYRPPPHVRDASSPLDYFRKMTPKQRAQANHIHLFTQQFFLEDDRWSDMWNGLQMGNEGRSLRGACRIAPKKLTITLRHTDWWYWENNDPLGIDPFRPGRTRANEMGKPVHHWQNNPSRRPWGTQFNSIPSLEELVIEFETIMRKRDQLDAIIHQALQWKFPLDAEKSMYLVAEPTSLSAYTWIGAKEGDLKRQRPAMRIPPLFPGAELYPPPVPQPEPEPEPEQVHIAPTLKPFDPQSHSTAQSGTTTGGNLPSDPETEEFYVVFLTWRKQAVKE
ncbi:hypothetical protein N7509_012661 [Penicillium cosmopolitanum]|uniref:Uncharacterized protein n=1 Tax=Penicillium cosmopolitanum TaxID=1131564 RepID=A0A9W9VEY8_9EURO|nr:uncharacterized protein N7509_012661 [Penicillium cosmopolitanum]KAJ5379542.1 hypothetical protein N7509_012661 [Penicillium cosmopolitanum]